MASSAYVAHFNAPKIWTELSDATVPRYNTVVIGAYTFAALIYIVVMSAGFLTFGGHAAGMILNNYANSDQLATIARMTVGTGLLCSYPLSFSALRESLLDLLGIKSQAGRDSAHVPITVTVIFTVAGLAIFLRDVGLVVGLGGALIGAMLMYSIPSYMNIQTINKQSRASSAEKGLNSILCLMGGVIAVIGVYLTLQKFRK